MARRHPIAAIVLTAIAWPVGPAASDDIPTLRVERLCHGIVSQSTDPLSKGEPTVSFQTCMQAEQDDREQLKKEWPTFSASDKKLCVTEAQMGGEASYTDLITCLEMARDVRKFNAPVASDRKTR